MKPQGGRPDPARRAIRLRQTGELASPVQDVADEAPVLQVLARVDGDPGEGVEAGRGAEECRVPRGDKDAARVGVEAREHGVVNG